jgi:hypothetical protein
MKTALVKTEKTPEGDRIEIRIVDKPDLKDDWAYLQNVKVYPLGICYTCIMVNEATDLFLNPFLFNYIKSLLV